MRLNQVTVPSIDYDMSVAFDVLLGLKLIVDAPPRYARFECPDADGGEPATFSIEFVEGYRGGDWPEVWFECHDVDGEVERLRSVGVEIVSEPETKSYLWREAVIRDPAGTRLKLYHAGENRRFPPWRVK
jgi:catechol 2,3-dioxygenase-like lactoylglutathione lyase family enzyme